ncbi:MAG TPA: EAL domain-containing protein [Leptolyngbyaceae cyanobacterium]
MIKKNFDPTKKSILIVDNNPDNIRFLSQILMSWGYQVRKALNGKTAIKSCQKTLPDLILLDIMMPDIDGYEVCQHLKNHEKTSSIPIIFLSALNDAFDKIKAFNVGGADYITKPFQLEEVVIRVQNQLIAREAEIKIIQLNTQLELKVMERTAQLKKANQELKREILERQHLQNQLLHLALHDSLTNLPNRALFMERLEAALQKAKSDTSYQFAVLFLDCDRFKVINDSLGHLVGDELLIAIANRLKSCINESDTLARLGGDEFAIILENIVNINSTTQQVGEMILEQFSTAFKLSRHEVFIKASIGISFGNIEYEKPEYLLRDADLAMYHAKALGKNRYYIFDPNLHQKAFKLLQLENDLRRAIERKEFVVYYQPIVRLNTGKIAGFEALIRWQHPTLGMVSPGEFIPIAEETGLIAEMDIWVLKKACQQLHIWQNTAPIDGDLTISVNLSARLFSMPYLVEKVEEIIRKSKINCANLKLEVTESTIMEDNSSSKQIIQAFKQQGIQLCIDDFGTGHSSLSYLEELPFSILKIDRCFVKRINEHQKTGLVPTIISIARSMKMSAIAEGIETLEQLARLRDLSCDFGQGYLFSQPLETKLATNLLVASPQW